MKKGDRVAVLCAQLSMPLRRCALRWPRSARSWCRSTWVLNPDEIKFILANSGARLLAVGPDLIEAGRAAIAVCTAVEKLIWLPGEDAAEPPEDIATFADLPCRRRRAARGFRRQPRSRRSSTPAAPVAAQGAVLTKP